MEKKTLALVAAFSIFLTSLVLLQSQKEASHLRQSPPETVPYVDINLYLGTWYQQAVIPYFFERDCTKNTATYSLNAGGKSIKVDNKCIRHGKEVSGVGKAIPEDKTNAKLKVEFVETLDIGAQYWIVRLAKDYSYSVISSPEYRYLWILYRQPIMPENLYNQIVSDLKKNGFPVQKLRRTQQ